MPITVYTRTTCAPCKMLKRFLQSKGIDYNEINVDENQEAYGKIIQQTGLSMVPVTVVGEKIIPGLNLPLLSKELVDFSAKVC